MASSAPEERTTRGADEDVLSDNPPTRATPSLPPRSPLRPTPRTRADSVAQLPRADSDSLSEILDSETIFMPLLRHRSLGSLSVLLDSLTQSDTSTLTGEFDGKEALDESGKGLPAEPVCSSPLTLSPIDTLESTSTDSSSLLPLTLTSPTSIPLSKRTHALLELLSSERAYASDLALLRAAHIPRALGQPAELSSAISEQALASVASTSNGSGTPPMTRDDVKIIFGNVIELAEFSDAFCERLEQALGDVVEGGKGEDCVGKLFLDIVHFLEVPYKTYITRHPASLSHYTALTTPAPSPALQAYLQEIKTLTSSLTHAWDIPSLLIKPVQRLLKYPLLLQTIYDETPEGHGDRENLKKAKEKMEEVARGVNEDRRRWEIVREVLNAGKKEIPGEKPSKQEKKKSTSVPLGVAASVKLGRMKSLTRKVSYGKGSVHRASNTDGSQDASEEAEAVAAYESDLQALDEFIFNFARAAKEWAAKVKDFYVHLLTWSLGFGRVIGVIDELGKGGRSEAFDAFMGVTKDHVIPLCEALQHVIETKLFADLRKLVDTMEAPKKLLEAMHTLEPLHYTLLNHTYGNSGVRPAPALLEASQSYVALRGQLAAELPIYLELMERGMRGCVGTFVSWQERFWQDVRRSWGELWDALREEGEELNGRAEVVQGENGEVVTRPIQGGAEKTVENWHKRWANINELFERLTITKRLPRGARDSLSVGGKDKNGKVSVKDKLAALQPTYVSPPSVPSTPTTPTSLLDYSEAEQKARDPLSESLERSYMYAYTMGLGGLGGITGLSPQKSPTAAAFAKNVKMSNGARDSADNGLSRSLGKRPSTESLRSGKSGKSILSGAASGRSRKSDSSSGMIPTLADEIGGIVASLGPNFGSKSKKIPIPKKGSSTSNHADIGPGLPPGYEAEELDLSPARPGRSLRRPSFRRKWSDNIRPSSSSRRSPSPAGSLSQTPPVPAPITSRSASFPMVKKNEPARDASPAKKSQQVSQPPQKVASHGRSLYACRVVHRCDPPSNVSYHALPFFTLRPGRTLDVLHESGHPSNHPDLPLFVDEGEDCLLLVRDRETHQIGWALASFLTPVR